MTINFPKNLLVNLLDERDTRDIFQTPVEDAAVRVGRGVQTLGVPLVHQAIVRLGDGSGQMRLRFPVQKGIIQNSAILQIYLQSKLRMVLEMSGEALRRCRLSSSLAVSRRVRDWSGDARNV